MNEQLRLEASLKDNASPGVRKLKKEIGEVRQTPGMTEVTKWFGKFEEGTNSFVKSGGDAAGVINAMGIGGLTAAASVATLVSRFKELGERTLAMKEFAREMGLTVDQVNAFAHAGQHFGVGADVMEGALNHLRSQMPQFQRGLGSMFAELSRWPELIAKLKKEGTEDQIKDIFAFLGQAKFQNEPQLQKQVLESIFGSGDEMEKLFAQGAQGFLAELEKQKRTLSPISPEMLKQAQDFRDATIDFNKAIENFELSAGPAFLKQMSSIVKEAKDFFETVNKGTSNGADKSADHADHRTWGQTFGDAAKDVDGALGWMWDKFSKATETPAELRHKSSYGGSNPLLHHTAFGGSSGGLGVGYGVEGVIASGTKAGFLGAMRELMVDAGTGAASGSTGLINASLGGSGGAAAGSRRGGLGDPTGFGGPSFKGVAPVGNWWNAEHVGHAVDRLMKEGGLSRAGAEGLVSRWAAVEAAQGPLSRNKSSGALGIGQWLGSRKKGFTADFDSQLSHALDELRTTESRAARQLRKAQNAREAAVGASMFERAEGYNPRSGVDNFTSKSEAAAGRIHALGRPGAPASHPPVYGEHRGAPVPIPYIQPLPGDPPRRAQGLTDPGASGSGGIPANGRLDAHIHVHGPAQKTTIKTDGAMISAHLHRWPTATEASDYG